MVAQGADRAATEQVSFTTPKTEGYHSSDDDLKHLGPARHEHMEDFKNGIVHTNVTGPNGIFLRRSGTWKRVQ
jgi:hypothetical protein